MKNYFFLMVCYSYGSVVESEIVFEISTFLNFGC